jgi:hypothetical protein
MPDNGTGILYSLFGDPAYPNSAYIFGGFRKAADGSPEAFWNDCMSKVRVAVEWGFQQILQLWSYLDFTRGMKIFESPIAQFLHYWSIPF